MCVKNLILGLIIIIACTAVSQAEALPFDFEADSSVDISSIVVTGSSNVFTEPQVFDSTVTINELPFIVGQTTFVVTSESISAHGQTMFGAKTNAEIALLTCASLPCSVFSKTDFEMYNATATVIGAWRSSRRGTGPH